ncbi:MAG: hypothetical protein A3F72_05720 [Bacteroidetes bacterium RIFCSPLOWO2_12_FULL_35_15]|nr:MAG: hypothetical protein A3F72_05720 [Bacteroidetes bacterium RIFCSPLOWO2_12_FULL_35_15]
MKNRDLILMLIEKSTNAFGEVFGITEMTKLKSALSIIQSTIQDSFGINSSKLSKNKLSEILKKGVLDLEQGRLLTNLLWAQAEIFNKLKQPQDSLRQYENALQILYWKAQQPAEKDRLERKMKIDELETIIEELKENSKLELMQ